MRSPSSRSCQCWWSWWWRGCTRTSAPPCYCQEYRLWTQYLQGTAEYQTWPRGKKCAIDQDLEQEYHWNYCPDMLILFPTIWFLVAPGIHICTKICLKKLKKKYYWLSQYFSFSSFSTSSFSTSYFQYVSNYKVSGVVNLHNWWEGGSCYQRSHL